MRIGMAVVVKATEILPTADDFISSAPLIPGNQSNLKRLASEL
jgi:hypothetical protein